MFWLNPFYVTQWLLAAAITNLEFFLGGNPRGIGTGDACVAPTPAPEDPGTVYVFSVDPASGDDLTVVVEHEIAEEDKPPALSDPIVD
jgi:hypothetical protein